MPIETVRKTFALSGDISDNRIRGAAAVMGNLDRGGDVIYPGAFKKTLKGFLENGSTMVGHEWEALPVAMPVAAKEQGSQLMTEAEFHTTQAAQDARTVCVERLEKGLSVGLSVGFSLAPEGRMWFSNGEQLLKHADGIGMDMSLFDTKTIKAYGQMCRGIFDIDELFEYSIVTVPMNPKATAVAAKDFSGMPLSGVSLNEQTEMTLSVLRELIRRAQGLKGLRLDQGYQGLTDARKSEIRELRGFLDELLVSSGADASLLAVQAEALRLSAVSLPACVS